MEKLNLGEYITKPGKSFSLNPMGGGMTFIECVMLHKIEKEKNYNVRMTGGGGLVFNS